MEKIRDCIPTIFANRILASLKAEDEWIKKIKKDKELTEKQKDDAKMLMYGMGILWAEIFTEGCKQKRPYTIQYLPDGSIIQRFVKVVK